MEVNGIFMSAMSILINNSFQLRAYLFIVNDSIFNSVALRMAKIHGVLAILSVRGLNKICIWI